MLKININLIDYAHKKFNRPQAYQVLITSADRFAQKIVKRMISNDWKKEMKKRISNKQTQEKRTNRMIKYFQ